MVFQRIEFASRTQGISGTRAIFSTNHEGGPKLPLMKPITRIFLASLCFAGIASTMQAVSPPPDGCYSNFTTAEGCNALQNLVGGAGNTGVGWEALFSNIDASFNTGVGAGALIFNN